jgi:hypothetical protein
MVTLAPVGIVVDEKGNLSWYIGTLLALFFLERRG